MSKKANNTNVQSSKRQLIPSKAHTLDTREDFTDEEPATVKTRHHKTVKIVDSKNRDSIKLGS